MNVARETREDVATLRRLAEILTAPTGTGGAHLSPGHAGDPGAPGDGRDGTSEVGGRAPSGGDGARDRRRAAACDLRGLIAPLEALALKSLSVRNSSEDCIVSDDDFVRHCLDKKELEALAEIEQAKRANVLSTADVDDTARQEHRARQKVDAILDRLRAIRGERRSIDKERQALPFWRRKHDRTALDARLKVLAAEEAELTASRAVLSGMVTNAAAAHARSQKAHVAAAAEAQKALTDQVARQERILATIHTTRTILRLWPPLVHMGPTACRRLGRDIGRKKTELRNPTATDIWGIPIAWGS